MPIYEYQCPECDTIFEEWAKASEMKEVAPCPQCQSPAERIISHTAFVLKGGGWYVTDYGYRKNISEDSATAGAAGSAAVPPATATDAAHSAANAAPSDSKDSTSAAPAAPSTAPAETAKNAASPTSPPKASTGTAKAAS